MHAFVSPRVEGESGTLDLDVGRPLQAGPGDIMQLSFHVYCQ